MSNLNFLSDNRLLEADLSMITGTVNAQYPLNNIKHDFTTKVFRSNEDVIEILIDLNSPTAIDAFAVVGSSVSGLGFGTMSLYGSITADFTGATEVSIDVSGNHNIGFKLWNSAGSFRYWKLVIDNTGGDYVEISNFYIGIKTELTNGIDIGSFKYAELDNSRTVKNKYGQRFIDTFNKIKTLEGQVKYLNKTEFDTLNNLYIQNGKSIPIWLIVDPDGVMATDGEFLFSGYFYFDKDLKYSSSGPCLYDVNLNFSEGT